MFATMTSCTKKLVLVISLLVICSSFLLAQNQSQSNSAIQKEINLQHHEVFEGEYSLNKSQHQRAPAYIYKTDNFYTIQVNVDENGNNIVGDAANEPSIAFDYTNPDRIAIGWRQFDDVSNNFRQAGYAYTTDGG